MTRQWTLTRDDFEALLAWLGPDREQAGKKYEDIRRTLIKIFTWNSCSKPEDCADETINRVTRKVPELIERYEGDPALYFYAVARNVIREVHRREAGQEVQLPERPSKEFQAHAPTHEEQEEAYDSKLKHECLRKCLKELPPEHSRLILKYYELEKHEKIAARRELAERENVEIAYLRVKLHRIRTALHKCIKVCLKRNES